VGGGSALLGGSSKLGRLNRFAIGGLGFAGGLARVRWVLGGFGVGEGMVRKVLGVGFWSRECTLI
jgi:hypothetical protein